MKHDDFEDGICSDVDNKECENCQGSGAIDCPLEYGGECPEQCPACGGSQCIACNKCDGSGLQEQN